MRKMEKIIKTEYGLISIYAGISGLILMVLNNVPFISFLLRNLFVSIVVEGLLPLLLFIVGLMYIKKSWETKKDKKLNMVGLIINVLGLILILIKIAVGATLIFALAMYGASDSL